MQLWLAIKIFAGSYEQKIGYWRGKVFLSLTSAYSHLGAVEDLFLVFTFFPSRNPEALTKFCSHLGFVGLNGPHATHLPGFNLALHRKVRTPLVERHQEKLKSVGCEKNVK